MNRTEHARMVQSVTLDTVIALLQDAGHHVTVNEWRGHHDITIDYQITANVKGALWTKADHGKGRYQFCIHQTADLYILGCMAHAPRFFVVPARVIGDRKTVAIWSEFPSKYVGRWTEYCDAWHIIEQELNRCKNSAIA